MWWVSRSQLHSQSRPALPTLGVQEDCKGHSEAAVWGTQETRQKDRALGSGPWAEAGHF